jgi:hypothetical protein
LLDNMKYLTILFTVIVCHAQVVMHPYRFAGSIEDNNLLPQLVAFWKLDETSGHAVDSNTNAYHLTQYGTVATNVGMVDGSRVFTGTLNGFYTNNAVFHDLDTNDFTMAFWFKPNTDSSGYLLSSGDFNAEFSWAIYVTDEAGYVDYAGGRNLVLNISGIPQTAISVAIGAESNPAPTDWCFGYVRRTGDNFDIGVAPPLESTITLTDTPYAASASFDIVNWGPDFSIGTGLFNGTPIEEWEGELDHVGIWQRALSDCEILKLLHLRRHAQFDSDACN